MGSEMCIRDRYGAHVKVIRIFNTYGPNMSVDDGRVISNLIVQALRGEKITIYGDGSQTRSFCYIDDLLEGIIRMMASDDCVYGLVNLGNPEEFTIKELADIVVSMIDTASGIEYKKLPPDDPKKRRPDISLAKHILDGWEPKVHLREGVCNTIEYFKGILQKY